MPVSLSHVSASHVSVLRLVSRAIAIVTEVGDAVSRIPSAMETIVLAVSLREVRHALAAVRLTEEALMAVGDEADSAGFDRGFDAGYSAGYAAALAAVRAEEGLYCGQPRLRLVSGH